MIRPWYRSLLFGLGLFWQLLLVGVWADAGAYHSVFSWNKTDRNLWVGMNEARIDIGCMRSDGFDVGAYLGGSKGFSFDRQANGADRLVWEVPKAVDYNWEEGSLGAPGVQKFRFHRIFVAWWLVVAISMTAWCGAMFWWQRRKTRLLKASAAESAEPPARSST